MASFPPGSLSQPTRRLPITVVKKARNLWNPSFDIIDGLFELTKSYRFQDCNLLFFYFFFLKLLQGRKDQPHRRDRSPGKGQQLNPFFALAMQRYTPPPPPERGRGCPEIKRPLFSFQIIQGLPILLLVSVAAQQASTRSPNRWRQGWWRAVNPTEWLALSGQELSRKSFQTLRTAASCEF